CIFFLFVSGCRKSAYVCMFFSSFNYYHRAEKAIDPGPLPEQELRQAERTRCYQWIRPEVQRSGVTGLYVKKKKKKKKKKRTVIIDQLNVSCYILHIHPTCVKKILDRVSLLSHLFPCR